MDVGDTLTEAVEFEKIHLSLLNEFQVRLKIIEILKTELFFKC